MSGQSSVGFVGTGPLPRALITEQKAEDDRETVEDDDMPARHGEGVVNVEIGAAPAQSLGRAALGQGEAGAVVLPKTQLGLGPETLEYFR